MPTHTDLEIVNALEVNPRAEWSEVAGVLGLAGPTVARRWSLLHDQGLAWITPTPGVRFLSTGWSAFVHLSSTPAEHDPLVRALCAEPAFGTVSLVSGSHDLFVDCFASSHEELVGIITGPLGALPGVTRREVVFVSELYRQASQWRSGALEPEQSRLMAAKRMPAPPGYTPDRLDAELLHDLSHDGRASWTHLGDRAGVSAQTAKRRVERLLAAGYVAMRCDAAPVVHGRRREVTLTVNVPATHVADAGRYFAGLPNCRVSAQVLGSQNLVVTLWVAPDYSQVQAHERELLERAPGSVVTSRQATVMTYKRAGHLLDAEGRRVGVVPLPLWQPRVG